MGGGGRQREHSSSSHEAQCPWGCRGSTLIPRRRLGSLGVRSDPFRFFLHGIETKVLGFLGCF